MPAPSPVKNAVTDLQDMVQIPAGEFVMGSESAEGFVADGEAPIRTVQLAAYRICSRAVSNAQFAEFVDATGHLSEAETFGWSYVFDPLLHPGATASVIEGQVPGASWWLGVRDTSWRCPRGPGSDLKGLTDHPVVHISWNDAVAYAQWRGGRLPTEAEWERAARGNLEQATYPWGDELTPADEHRANIWQGTFPSVNTTEGRFFATAPVDAFEPNGFGLFNTAGNVWEWTADWFSPTWHRNARVETRVDPQGPRYGQARVVRGGSYLCHKSYCNRYRVAARTQTTPDSSLGHTGFRLAADA